MNALDPVQKIKASEHFARIYYPNNVEGSEVLDFVDAEALQRVGIYGQTSFRRSVGDLYNDMGWGWTSIFPVPRENWSEFVINTINTINPLLLKQAFFHTRLHDEASDQHWQEASRVLDFAAQMVERGELFESCPSDCCLHEFHRNHSTEEGDY